ncbi:hypothetical protein YDYSG_36640 [Paenibacillus tyrfis]|nr:hypothetical protein YDYSG_36640 [Paenibacillus tyrfis]
MAKSKVPKRPTRDEFELEEMGDQLVEAKDEDAEVLLTVWGWRSRCMARSRRWILGQIGHVNRHGEEKKVPFIDIMKVESPGS